MPDHCNETSKLKQKWGGEVFNDTNDSIKEMRTESAGTDYVRCLKERDMS